MLNKRWYDGLKFIALILLPAIGTLYFSLTDLWNLPYATQVVGTITAVDTLLGALLQLSTNKYNNSDRKFDGTIEVTEAGNQLKYLMNLNGDPEELRDKDEVVFKVDRLTGTGRHEAR